MSQNARDIPASVKDAENLERVASRSIDEIGEDPVEKHLPSREIGAAVAATGNLGQLVETPEEFGHHPVRRLDALLIQEISPDGVDIDWVSWKGSKVSQPGFFAQCASLNAASFRRASSGL